MRLFRKRVVAFVPVVVLMLVLLACKGVTENCIHDKLKVRVVTSPQRYSEVGSEGSAVPTPRDEQNKEDETTTTLIQVEMNPDNQLRYDDSQQELL
jgi:hypothetical protein